jgi:ABC-2 type transport system ATP-binding protein
MTTVVPVPTTSDENHKSAVAFANVSYSVGKHLILDDITLAFEQNHIAGVLGPNGAGKTTLLSLMTGLIRASGGRITVLGKQLPGDTAFRKRIGMVLQETALYEELSVFETLRFAASLYSVPSAHARIAEVLELIGLTERRNDLVRILSGGLRRRVAIARALLHTPELLIIDEPTLGVDATARHAIWEHLRLLRSLRTTIIVATNYLDEAQALCDVVSVLNNGKLILTETPDQLIARGGCCLDIDCQEASAALIADALNDEADILRMERTARGIAVFVDSTTIPDQIIHTVLQTAPIDSFRFRTADLAEVFQALKERI